LIRRCGNRLAVGVKRVVGFAGAGGEFDRLGQLFHRIREVVAVKAGGGKHDIDPRPFQHFTRHQLDVDDPAAAVPHRFDTHRPQRLRFEQALMAHGFDRPQREGELLRRLAGLGGVRRDQGLGGFLAGRPGLLGRHAGRVEAVQIAPGRQRVRVLDRVAAVGGRAVLAGEGGEQALHFTGGRKVGVPALGLGELRV
jgi:hypothetical protein